MKIKDLAAMAGNCRHMDLINTRDSAGHIVRQHLMLSGKAIFPLDGMQPITPETLLTIADVEEEIRDKYAVWQGNINKLLADMVDDYRETDRPAKMGKINLETKYAKLISVHTDDGKDVHFIPSAMLKPIKDARQLNLVIRRTIDEQNYIVALDGVSHIATFAPHEMWVDFDVSDELHKVWLKARDLASKNELIKNEKN